MVVKSYGGGPKPFARVFLIASKYRVLGFLHPFVDTGAPLTCLSSTDAERLHVPFNVLSAHTPRPTVHYIGGLSFWAYPMENVTLKTSDEDSKEEEFILNPIYALKLTKKDNESIQRARLIPSILGMDFLTKYRFTLNFNLDKKIANITKP